jgi:hypothetical protein
MTQTRRDSLRQLSVVLDHEHPHVRRQPRPAEVSPRFRWLDSRSGDTVPKPAMSYNRTRKAHVSETTWPTTIITAVGEPPLAEPRS